MKNDFSPEFCYASLNDLILCEDDLCCCLYQSTLEENEVFFLMFSIVGVYDYVATLLLTSALVPSLSLLLLFKQKCVGTDSTHPPLPKQHLERWVSSVQRTPFLQPCGSCTW